MKAYEHEMSKYKQNDQISSNKFMNNINMLLTNEIDNGAKSHSKTIKFFKNFTSTFQSIFDFKFLFYERFPSRTIKLASIFINIELQQLKQRKKKSLIFYYKRTAIIMQKMKSSNGFTFFENVSLILLKIIMLNKILKIFTNKIKNVEIRHETNRELITFDKSLKTIYQLTEKIRRNKNRLQKQQKEKFKKKNLSFLKISF